MKRRGFFGSVLGLLALPFASKEANASNTLSVEGTCYFFRRDSDYPKCGVVGGMKMLGIEGPCQRLKWHSGDHEIITPTFVVGWPQEGAKL